MNGRRVSAAERDARLRVQLAANFARREIADQRAVGGLLPGDMTAEHAVDQAC